MCGIAGACGLETGAARRAVAAMCEQMRARGPDDVGVALVDDGEPVVLGNRRLAIVDPSPAGHQPMSDPERGTTIVFNGMIYNFRELRAELERAGERFRSNCDTEVALKAYGRYGADCVERLRGMFAFAVWDGRRRELVLARDRLGIKPLYYRLEGGRLLFASQVKALLASGLVPSRLSAPGLRSYLAYGAVGEPLTAIEGVHALPAAHVAVLRDARLELHRYWQPSARPAPGPSRAEAVRELRELLAETVRAHLVSDAPLGVFLSGGLDSSLLTALAARCTSRLRTVSVVFEDEGYSEAEHSELVARCLGSEHVQVTLSARDLLEWLGDAFDAMDQPTFDGLNTFAVSRAAATSGLKVSLSGLGADELFDGYGYVRRVRLLERAARVPSPVAEVAARGVKLVARDGAGEKSAAWLRGGAEAGTSYELLRRLFLEPDVRRLAPSAAGTNGYPRPGLVDASGDLFAQVSLLDLTSYTRDVLLRDTDGMAMANSLEVRVPYLDHELVEWVLRLPAHVKGRGKALLAEAAAGLVPAEILARRKHGFLLPLTGWLRGELRREVEERLRHPPAALAEAVDAAASAAVWERYLRDGRHWLRPWSLYALARWTDSLPTLGEAR